MAEPARDELEAAHCWEASDAVPGRPAMTAFRRRARLHHARWREARGLPAGSQPMNPKPGAAVRVVGSRLPLDVARAGGATFLTPGALAAARARTDVAEPHQRFDAQRLWADLLWSPTLAVNLFGDLAADPSRATRALRTIVPAAPGTVAAVRFEHSPGRLAGAFLGNLSTFHTAFELDRGDGTLGIVGVIVRYHEARHSDIPKPENLARYLEVCERSRLFRRGFDASIRSSPLVDTWLTHALVQAMLQHHSGRWTWGHLVIVHPEGNTDQADVATRYRGLLSDPDAITVLTLEALLDAGALAPATVAALRERYVP